MTGWQIMYLIGTVVGVAAFIELVGWVTDDCRIINKGLLKDLKLAFKTDLERTKNIWRNRHEKERTP